MTFFRFLMPAVIFFSTAVFAQDHMSHDPAKIYVGGGFSYIKHEEKVHKLDFASVDGKFGIHGNKFYSAEIRIGFGIKNDTVNHDKMDKKFELSNYAGVFFIGEYPVTEKISPYGILGATTAKVKLVGDGGSSVYDQDFSYGVGVKYKLNRHIVGAVEYISYISHSDFDLNAVTLSANYVF